MTIPKDMHVGATFDTNNCGKILILEYNHAKDVKVKFLDTNHTKTTRAEMIRSGMVKDPFAKSVYGVGFYGVGKHSFKEKKKYNTWAGMITRCYSEKSLEKYPTYRGCTVCPEWHDYQIFGDWYDENYPEKPKKGVRYEIDKDLFSVGEKVYSPKTCVIVTQQENICITHAGEYKMISPNGEVVEIINMSEFCRNNNLRRGNMCLVANGDRIQHKGWRKFNG